MSDKADATASSLKGEVIEVFDCRTSYSIDDVMMRVIVAQIEPKRASEVLQEFAVRLPLQEYNLGHMKRVKRDKNDSSILEVLVSPETHYDTVPKDLISMCKPITRIVSVPKLRPLTRAEFEEWGKNWPTIFRPNAVDKERERGFTPEEVAQHVKYMDLVNEDSVRITDAWQQCFQKGSNGYSCPVPPFRGGGIIVNPVNGRVVASSFQGFQYTFKKLGAGAVTNPLLDSTMLCVEGVAVLVRGEQLDAPSSSSSSAEATPIEAGDSDRGSDDLIPDDQYLCTGLDLYLTHEPDLMTCMALVHSRIRRVYFQDVSPEYGALSSHYSFHSLRALNHHYRVFRVIPADASGAGTNTSTSRSLNP